MKRKTRLGRSTLLADEPMASVTTVACEMFLTAGINNSLKFIFAIWSRRYDVSLSLLTNCCKCDTSQKRFEVVCLSVWNSVKLHTSGLLQAFFDIFWIWLKSDKNNRHFTLRPMHISDKYYECLVIIDLYNWSTLCSLWGTRNETEQTVEDLNINNPEWVIVNLNLLVWDILTFMGHRLWSPADQGLQRREVSGHRLWSPADQGLQQREVSGHFAAYLCVGYCMPVSSSY